MSTPADYFARLYAADDPYGYRVRWYEARKRQLLLASLSRPRFASGWELGCSNGELTAALAPRCDALLATDQSARAVELAHARTSGFGHVTVRRATHPADRPAGRFDLIVFSEIGYFMGGPALERTIGHLLDALAPDGLVVACHWLPRFDAAAQSGREVHAALADRLRLPVRSRYEDEDFLLESWGGGASVARAEGLR